MNGDTTGVGLPEQPFASSLEWTGWGTDKRLLLHCRDSRINCDANLVPITSDVTLIERGRKGNKGFSCCFFFQPVNCHFHVANRNLPCGRPWANVGTGRGCLGPGRSSWSGGLALVFCNAVPWAACTESSRSADLALTLLLPMLRLGKRVTFSG